MYTNEFQLYSFTSLEIRMIETTLKHIGMFSKISSIKWEGHLWGKGHLLGQIWHTSINKIFYSILFSKMVEYVSYLWHYSTWVVFVDVPSRRLWPDVTMPTCLQRTAKDHGSEALWVSEYHKDLRPTPR